MTLMQQMAGQNPQVAQAMRLMQGKTPQQLRQTAGITGKTARYIC